MLEPMLASLMEAPLEDKHLVYEPKYDGIRAIVEVGAKGTPVRLWSRLGNEKTRQFQEIADALAEWAKRRTQPVVLDGEIVALNEQGEPIGFQNLQGRIHLGGVAPSRKPKPKRTPSSSVPTALIVFDLLRDGATDYRSRPLTERRAALEKLFRGAIKSPLLRISEQASGNGRALYDRAIAGGWEGLIVKRAASLYHSGKRTPEWRKLKIVKEQEFVVGGWTEPRQTRSHFGALLLGVYDHPAGQTGPARPALTYVGHVGTGFDGKELTRLMKVLKPLETSESPFAEKPPTNTRPHWVKPELVVQVRFTEWTADGVLRHPVYLGQRDDKNARDVAREQMEKRRAPKTIPPRRRSPVDMAGADGAALVERLRELEDARKDGMLEIPGGGQLKITNLHKVFWPALKLTKGDLFRYYATIAPALLPAIADRPLVMKRFPNGIDAKPFYQHRAETPPPAVRVEKVTAAESRPHVIGGTLATLMYTTQLAAISQDPWFSRVGSERFADHIALDLDPPDGTDFARILDVARWVRDELAAIDAPCFAKTSGSRGLHIYVPLPSETPYEAGLLFAEIVATMVATKHPRQATVERAVRARGSRIYVDYLQNILGKTLASAYSVRANDLAGVSAPLTWDEIDSGDVDRAAFTLTTMAGRLASVGDLWKKSRQSRAVDLERVIALASRAK
jgi:bifunctional non-homologous end joining protein LigD